MRSKPPRDFDFYRVARKWDCTLSPKQSRELRGSNPHDPAISMKQATTKYPVSAAGTVFPKGTIVEVLEADSDLVKEKFPAAKKNDESPFVAVKFPTRESVTIVAAKSIDFIGV